jgi:CDP-2,3-bis-(O-geranylgeranyl)-sn-glycerol synthase
MNEVLWFLVFFLPAYVANMSPVFVRKVNVLNYPIDGGVTLRGHPLLGKNKTWRGLIFGTLMGGLTGGIMQLSGLDFVWWHGFILGFAALLGDALKSMAKRQVGIRPGGRWMPFDQLDYMVVALLFSLPLEQFTVRAVVLGFIIIFVGTVAVQLIGGWTRLKADSL